MTNYRNERRIRACKHLNKIFIRKLKLMKLVHDMEVEIENSCGIAKLKHRCTGVVCARLKHR